MWRVLVFVFWWFPFALDAGPWPQGRGNMFFSVESFYGTNGSGGTSLFFEIGQSDRLTYGGGLFVNWDGEIEEFNGFTKLSFDLKDPNAKFALTFGSRMRAATQSIYYWQYETVNGYTYPSALIEQRYNWLSPSTTLGMSWGKGLSQGWVSIDADVEYDFDRDLAGLSALGTVGWRLNDTWTIMGQSSLRVDSAGARDISVSPMVVWSLTDRLDLTAGVLIGHSDGVPQTSVRFGMWSRF